jgi:Ca2+-binding RTX toxin-like protein
MSALLDISSLNRAFKNVSPSNTTFAAQQTAYAAGATAFANSFNDATLTDAALAKLVLTNMGVLPSTDASVQALEPALADYFRVNGNRGLVVLQLANILSGLENATGALAVYKTAAAAWNKEVVDAAAYSSNTANTVDSDKTPSGSSFTLTSTVDTFVGTAGNDTFSGTAANLGATDAIIDSSTTDNDTLTLTGAAFGSSIDTSNGANIRNIETVKAIFDSLTASTFNAAGITTKSNITVSEVRVGSGAAFTVSNVAADSTVVAGAGVNDLTVTMAAGGGKSVTVDGADATTAVTATVSDSATVNGNVTVTANKAASVTATAAKGTATLAAAAATTIAATGATINVTAGAEAGITITGVGSADKATIVSAKDITVTSGNAVETVSVSGTDAAITAAIAGTAATTYVVAGTQNVTLSGNTTSFSGKTVTDSSTATSTLKLTTVGATADLSKAAVDKIDVAAAAAGAATLTVNNNANVSLSADTTNGALTISADDGVATTATTYLKGTLNLALAKNVAANAVVVTNSAASQDGFDTVNLSVGTAQTGLVLTAGTAKVVATGSKALVLGSASTAGGFDASALTGKLTATLNDTNKVITAGSANDALTFSSTLATAKLDAGAGNDSINVGVVALGTIAAGEGTDTLNVTAAVDLSGATITGVEYLNLNGNATSVAQALVSGASMVVDGTAALTVKGLLASVDLSNLVFASTATTVVDYANNKDATLGASAAFTVTGSANADTITTQDGADVINAGKGNDTIVSGNGNDTVNGEDGDDSIDAGAGNDVIDGGAGADKILGGAGNDTITAGAGADTVVGGAGKDTINLTEATQVADVVVVTAATDGSAAGAAAGTFTNYDVITGFVSGSDTIVFDTDITTAGVQALVDGVKVVLASTAATTDANDLTLANITNVDKVVAFLADSGQTFTASKTSVVAVTFADSNTTAIYGIVNNATAGVIATELTLIGTVDATLVAADLVIA